MDVELDSLPNEVVITSYSIHYTKLYDVDYVIAAMHEVVLDAGTKTKNTQAVLGALNNPYVDVIAHPDNPSYALDYETIVKEAAKLGKLLEVNDHSFVFRQGGLA